MDKFCHVFSSCKATCPSSPAELGQGTWTTAGCLVIVYMGPGWNGTWATWLRSLRLGHCAMAALLSSDTVCLTCPSPCRQSCAGRRIALRQSCAGRRIALRQSCAGRRIALRQSCAGRRIALHQSCAGRRIALRQSCAGIAPVNPVLGAGLFPVLPGFPASNFGSNAKGRMGKIKLFPTTEYTSKQASDPVVPGAVHRHLPRAIKIGQNRGSDQPDPGAVSRRL